MFGSESSGSSGEFKSPIAIFLSISKASSNSSFSFNNNDEGFTKLRLKGTFKVTSSSGRQQGTAYFKGYLKNEDGSRGSLKSISIASASANSPYSTTVEIDTEIDISQFWFPDNAVSSYAPKIETATGYYYTVDLQIPDVVFSK